MHVHAVGIILLQKTTNNNVYHRFKPTTRNTCSASKYDTIPFQVTGSLNSAAK